jgi:hypothetical protein
MHYNDYQRNSEREVAKVLEFACKQHVGRHKQPTVTSFRVAAFKDLDMVYQPYARQVCNLSVSYPANWWEALKVTLPEVLRFKWVQSDLNFGWIRDIRTEQYAVVNKSEEYCTELTVKNFTVYVDNNLGAEVFRDKFTPSEDYWYNVQPD